MDEQLRKDAILRELARHPFRPAWWLPGKHFQSGWGPLFYKDGGVPLRCERWETPDEDFLDVHFSEGQPQHPVVLMQHGLEGSAGSFYVRGFHEKFCAIGWCMATMEYRTCGGKMNRTKRLYHMGETSDLAFVVDQLRQRFSDRPLYLIGVSLGGNVVAKWLGEMGEAAQKFVAGAAVISPPFDAAASSRQFHRTLGGFYARYFLRRLIPKALEKAKQFPGLIDEEAVKQCKDFHAFDTHVTARIHGFADSADYYNRVGSKQYVQHIRVPTMLLTSADDPFNAEETIPREAAEQSPWLYPQFTRKGGHVGFVAGALGNPVYWAEEQVVRFFKLLQG